MIFPGCEANTGVTCLQVIPKKEVIAKIRRGARNPKSASGMSKLVKTTVSLNLLH